MDEKKKSVWDTLKNKYVKAAIFFGFYFFFFLIIIGLVNSNNSTNNEKDTNNTTVDKWTLLDNNYEYLYDIVFKENNKHITLEGKHYANKNLFTKSIDGVVDATIYIFYDKISVKKDIEWVEDDTYNIVYPNFDNNLINILYIKDLIRGLTTTKTTTNFDGTVDEQYLYNNIDNIIVTSKDNIITKVTIDNPFVDITLQYKNINKVEEFVVDN